MLTKVRGRFVDVDTTVAVAERMEDTHVETTIVVAWVDPGDATRDGHLRSSHMFDVDNHATVTLRSTHVERDGRTETQQATWPPKTATVQSMSRSSSSARSSISTFRLGSHSGSNQVGRRRIEVPIRV